MSNDGVWVKVYGSDSSVSWSEISVVSGNPTTDTYTDSEGDWRYWMFENDGSFQSTPGAAEVLLVAGGGSGGRGSQSLGQMGGGGGAGGVVKVKLYLSGIVHDVVVGAGGDGTSGGDTYISLEGTSVRSSGKEYITAVGGGMGGGYIAPSEGSAGIRGGSGGGPVYNGQAANGKGVFGQGHEGSTGPVGSYKHGGGAGGPGTNSGPGPGIMTYFNGPGGLEVAAGGTGGLTSSNASRYGNGGNAGNETHNRFQGGNGLVIVRVMI
jgi:hypothetical protein